MHTKHSDASLWDPLRRGAVSSLEEEEEEEITEDATVGEISELLQMFGTRAKLWGCKKSRCGLETLLPLNRQREERAQKSLTLAQ